MRFSGHQLKQHNVYIRILQPQLHHFYPSSRKEVYDTAAASQSIVYDTVLLVYNRTVNVDDSIFSRTKKKTFNDKMNDVEM